MNPGECVGEKGMEPNGLLFVRVFKKINGIRKQWEIIEAEIINSLGLVQASPLTISGKHESDEFIGQSCRCISTSSTLAPIRFRSTPVFVAHHF